MIHKWFSILNFAHMKKISQAFSNKIIKVKAFLKLKQNF